jgi:hypothetical protein
LKVIGINLTSIDFTLYYRQINIKTLIIGETQIENISIEKSKILGLFKNHIIQQYNF